VKALTRMRIILPVSIIVIVIIAAGAYLLLSRPPEKTEILIGAAVSLTGPLSTHGKKVVEGYKLWEKVVNAKGGILGKPVKLIIYDDASDPTTTKTLYERLITVDKVDFLLGPYASSCSFAAAPVAEKYKMVMIHPLSNAITVYNYTANGWDWQFCAHPCGLTDTQLLQHWEAIINLIASEKRPKTVGYINTADVFPRALAAGIEVAVKKYKDYGFTIVFHEEIPKGATDVTAVVSKAKAANAEIFIVIGYLSEEVLVIRTMHELGYHPKIVITGTGGVKEFYDTLGPIAEGIMCHIPFHVKYPLPAAQEFVKAFRSEYGRDPEYYQALAYATAQILEAAIKGAGSLDNAKIKEWLLTHSVETVWGTWKVDWNRVKEGIRYVCEVKAASGQWQNGVLQIIWPPELATAKYVYPKPWP